MGGLNGIGGVRRHGENRESEKWLHSGHEITTDAKNPRSASSREDCRVKSRCVWMWRMRYLGLVTRDTTDVDDSLLESAASDMNAAGSSSSMIMATLRLKVERQLRVQMDQRGES
jgi:hypothetical protein